MPDYKRLIFLRSRSSVSGKIILGDLSILTKDQFVRSLVLDQKKIKKGRKIMCYYYGQIFTYGAALPDNKLKKVIDMSLEEFKSIFTIDDIGHMLALPIFQAHFGKEIRLNYGYKF